MTITTVRRSRAVPATSESLANVGSWYQQLAGLQTGTIQDSWDHNSTARNANLEMMNNVIKLGAAMADLINSRNAVATSSLSSSSRSTVSDRSDDQPQDATGFCDPRQNLVWDLKQKACVVKREDVANVQLMLQPQ